MTGGRAPRFSLTGVGLFYGAMAAVALGASYVVFGEPPLRLRVETEPVWMSGLAGVLVGLALVASSRWSSGRFAWAQRLDDNFRRVIGQVGPRDAGVMALSSGLAEEMLFRGFLLRLFLPRAGALTVEDAVLGLVLSSLAFGVLHIGPDRSYLPWTVFASVVGALFAALTLWSGDITAAVVAHLTVNYFNFLAIGRTR